MPTTFANSIDGNALFAARSTADKDGNQIDTTYVKSASLATVATSGDYDDLSNKPTIPAAQVQSDYSQSDSSAVDYIKNKPDLSIYAQSSSLATVATSGSYNDLANKPTIPAAQVQSDWTESDNTDPSYIQNKPEDYSLVAGSNVTITKDDTDKEITVAASFTQAQANWNESDTTAASYIQNKPTIPSGEALVPAHSSSDSGKVLGVNSSGNTEWVAGGGGTVDQTYNASSTNAQSGTAVAGAIATVRQVPASTSSDADKVLTVDSTGNPVWDDVPTQPTELFEAVYGTTTYADIASAITTHKMVFCRVNTGSTFYRMVPLSYVDEGASRVEFHFYRSKTPNNGNDSVFIYQVDSTNTWATTERNVNAGLFEALYGTTTYADIVQAITDKKVVYCRISAYNASSRMAFLAYIGNGNNGHIEFQYYKSNSDPTANDSVFVYDVDRYNTWTTTERPAGIKTQVNSDWNASSGAAQILNKPSLSTVATTGDYNDLSNKPSIPAAQVQSDYSQSDNTAVDYIKNKPDLSVYAQSSSLATVATSGSYNDLSNKPSIPTATSDLTNDSGYITASDVPAAQDQADWTEADSSDPAYIKNKPSLATVATSGSYNDLSDKPTIPAAQIQSDYTQSDSSALDYIKNKPDLSVYATSSSLATVATSGSYNDLSNKPTIPAAQVNADWNASSGVAQILNKPILATVATTGSYNDLSNTPTIPDPLPSATSADEGKVLTVDSNGEPEWATPGGNTPELSNPIYLDSNNKIGLKLVDTAPGLEILPKTNEGVSGTNIYASNGSNSFVMDLSYISYYSSRDAKLVTTGLNTAYFTPPSDMYKVFLVQGNSLDEVYSETPYAISVDSWQIGQSLNEVTLYGGTLAFNTYNDFSFESDFMVFFVDSNYGGDASGIIDSDNILSWNDYQATLRWEVVNVFTEYGLKATVDQSYNYSSPNAQSGYAVAEAIATVKQVPYSDSSDEGKVLKVNSSGDPEWQAGAAPQVQSNWTESDTTAVSYIQNKPNLATVATSGSYNDLSNKPTIPDGVPTVTSNDDGKILTAVYSGGTGSYGWSAPSGSRTIATTYTTVEKTGSGSTHHFDINNTDINHIFAYTMNAPAYGTGTGNQQWNVRLSDSTLLSDGIFRFYFLSNANHSARIYFQKSDGTALFTQNCAYCVVGSLSTTSSSYLTSAYIINAYDTSTATTAANNVIQINTNSYGKYFYVYKTGLMFKVFANAYNNLVMYI